LFKQITLHQIFTTNALGANVTKTKCPIAMYKVLKSDFFGNFGPLTKWFKVVVGPWWDKETTE
jgi:hypothetical protein